MDLPHWSCRALMPDGVACSHKTGPGKPLCDKHLGPLIHSQPRTPAESFEVWRVHAGGLARRLRAGDRPQRDTYDEEFVQTLLPLALPLYDWYFRVEVAGVENIPAEGAVILAANHSGAIPIDGAMLKVAVLREHGRNAWLLAADLAFTIPGFRDVLRMTGNARAGREETMRLLNAGEMIGVFPEGFKGIGKGWKKRYQLQRFGRGGFVEVAFESGAPIVPVAIVGAEEAYPMIARWPSLARRLGLPYIPVTPFFPWLGPLGAIPLPSKWMIQFGEPVPTIQHGPEAADDTQLVLETGEQIRQTIRRMLKDMLTRRRRTFF